MTQEQKKTTALEPSVAADEEQSSSKNTIESISESSNQSNEPAAPWGNLRRRCRLLDPAYLHTVTMSELYDTVYSLRPSVVDGLLSAGVYILAGAPKTGKSFLVAQIAYHVSTGTPLWNYEVQEGTVLYLALEDDFQRIQKRMYRMFGTNSTDNLVFAVAAKQLGSGLNEQLQKFVREHPDTRLIIIDTLQKIREAQGDKYSYANDYEIMGRLKQFADQNMICILVVHHTRKQQAEDKFDRISGTNGLLGAADGALMLEKAKRTGNKATLDVSGRDQQDQCLTLVRDAERLIWKLESAETELWEEPADPILEEIAKLVTQQNPEWNGSATELAQLLDAKIQPSSLTRHLNIQAGRLLQDYHVQYSRTRNHEGRWIKLELKS